MARYRKIDPRIWHDDKFPSLPDDAKLIFFHLLTSPRSNMIGLFVQGKTDITEYLGWPQKRLTKPFRELLSKGLIKYDSEVRIVYLPNFLKYESIENLNQAKAAAKLIDELPNNPYYQPLKLFLEQLGKPFLEPLIEKLDNCLRNSRANQEQEQEQEHKTIPAQNGFVLESFEDFYRNYPKKKDKPGAEKAWRKLRLDKDLQIQIMCGLGRAVNSLGWSKDNGQFIPYPAKWIRSRGWEDEYLPSEPPRKEKDY